jgi:hypothetical protein
MLPGTYLSEMHTVHAALSGFHREERTMLRTISLTLALSLAAAAPAFARHCPADMAAIDRALPTAQISASDKQKVMELRKQGEDLHKAGNHPESERLLDQAKKILKI